MAERQRDDMRRVILENPSGDRKHYVPRVVREDSEAMYYIWEPPKTGYRYLMAADLAAGEEVTESGERDCQTVLVIRQGFMSAQSGAWIPPKVVATIKPDCRVDQLVLADMAWRLSRHYGGCLIVPEVNYDRGFIRALRDLGAHIYERERAATDKEDQRPTKKFGFSHARNGRRGHAGLVHRASGGGDPRVGRAGQRHRLPSRVHFCPNSKTSSARRLAARKLRLGSMTTGCWRCASVWRRWTGRRSTVRRSPGMRSRRIARSRGNGRWRRSGGSVG
jgi:hypothetical protein